MGTTLRIEFYEPDINLCKTYLALVDLGGRANYNVWKRYTKEVYNIRSSKMFNKYVLKLLRMGLVNSDPPYNVRVRGKKRIYFIIEETLGYINSICKSIDEVKIETALKKYDPYVFIFFSIASVSHKLLKLIVFSLIRPETTKFWKKVLQDYIESIFNEFYMILKEGRYAVDKSRIEKIIDFWFEREAYICRKLYEAEPHSRNKIDKCINEVMSEKHILLEEINNMTTPFKGTK